MKKSKVEDLDEIPDEVDFSKGVRGLFAGKFEKGSRVVVLDPDVAKIFPTQEAANEALRDMARTIKRSLVTRKPRNAKTTGADMK